MINSFGVHVLDFETISTYSEKGQSPIHRASPWTKLAFMLLIVVTVVLTQNLTVLLLVYASVLLTYCISGLPRKKLVQWYLLPMFFVLLISIVFLFNEPGRTLARIDFYNWSLALSDAGLLLLAKLFVRSLIIVTFSFILIMTTRYDQIGYLVQKILPSPTNSMFLLSYRFSFIISENASTMLKAVYSRGGNLVKGFFRMSHLYGAIIGASLINAVEKAERVGKAMETRGFSDKLHAYEQPPLPSLTELLFLVISVILLLTSYMGGLLF